MSIDEDIDNLKRRHSTATKMRLRAESRHEQAQASLDAVLAELRDQFAITDLSQARTVLAELQQRVQTGITDLDQALTKAENRE